MTASTWLRTLAVVLAIFTAGHTIGTAAPHVTRGADQAAVFAAMQAFHFRVMGFDRTYWEFYRGFALTISLLLLVMTGIAWQLGWLAQRFPRQTLPMAIALQLTCVGLLALSWTFFFGGPIAISVVAVLSATAAVRRLAREGRSAAGRVADTPPHSMLADRLP
jgi:hypothetical protein